MMNGNLASSFIIPHSSLIMARAKKPPAEMNTASQGYTVLARRYRPQQFSDLVGQEPVARALVNALKSNRVAHAYLFTGARGVGKTSTARILAKALNCERGPTDTPCDECAICKSIASGDDVDVIEIDGASNRRIEESREIRGNVQYRPQRARYKIYIIDEVHMLTKEAFNALLKTLEEPPPHVKFIFATTDVQKIPITILSRCQRFDFAGIGTPRIVERLRAVVESEGMQADDDALELVARRASGSMRDAQSLLDQLLAFGGDRLTADQVHHLLGTAGDERVLALAAAVLEHDPKRALDLLAAGADEGLQLGELTDQLIAYWRDLMVLNSTGGVGTDLSVPPRHRDTLTKQAESLKLDTILAGLDILNSTRARLRTSNYGRVLVEMALVRLGRLDDLASLSQLVQWLGQPQPARPDGAKSAVSPAASSSLSEGVKKKSLSAAEPTAAAAPIPLSEESLSRIWAEFLSQAGPMTAGQLQKAQPPAIIGPNALVLRFEARYTSQGEYCQDPTRVARMEEALRRITGHACQIRVEVVRGSALANSNESADDPENSPSRYRRQRAEAEKEPLLKRAMEVLGAQIVQFEEGFGAAPATALERVETAEAEEV
jgi:DNA polymerase-3 subunit gamma/tau